MRWILSYNEFLLEGKKGLTNAGSIMRTNSVADVQYSINFSDETLEILRRKLYDKYIDAADKKDAENINKCVSTFVYCLDKRVRFDSDIVELLAKIVKKTPEKIIKELTKETDEFYNGGINLYGMKM
ncbi:hypothetical protein EBU94_01190 [bacterium]|nr:hypothetical protein [bacterium]